MLWETVSPVLPSDSEARKEKNCHLRHFTWALRSLPNWDLTETSAQFTFCMAQLAMDMSPGVGMLAGAAVHGLDHTIWGRCLLHASLVFVAPGVCRLLLKRWNKEVIHYDCLRWCCLNLCQKIAVIIGAFTGTLSRNRTRQSDA